MNGKFSTTSSSLFNKQNPEQLPSWMENLEINLKEKESIDLGIETKGSFAEKQTVNRDEFDGTPRYLEASFNDTKLITDAKIHLARFLSGRYYKVEGKTANNSAKLNVKIDGVPADFTFNFTATAGKLNNDTTFSVLMNSDFAEYPFSKAGFDECLADIRNNRIKTSQKVESVGKYSIINREEIIRRYNGQLRDATNKINELLSEGTLVGVGSNSYASYYDIDHLFPQMEKEAGEPQLPAFEFAPNKEHIAANQHKGAKVLTIEASKLLSQLFPDFVIRESARDNDELLIKAEVLNGYGISKTVDFSFGVENEKIASLKLVEYNDERMTVEQFLNRMDLNSNVVEAYLNQTSNTAKRIYRGAVLTRKTIAQKLNKVVSSSIINDVIENWIDQQLVTPVNSTTFITNHSFPELLASISTKVLTAEEIDEIKNYQKSFGSGLDFERQEVKDTGIRDFDEVNDSNSLKFANLHNYVSKYFKNFKLENFNNDVAALVFVNPKTGVRNRVLISGAYDGNKVISAGAYIEKDFVELNQLCEVFEKSPVLAAYLQDKNNLVVSATVLSEAGIKDKLKGFVNLSDVDNVINDWYQRKLIANIGNGLYTSNHSFEELLSMANIKPLNDDEIKDRIARSQRDRGLKLQSSYIQDNDTRDLNETWSPERMVLHVKAELNKLFKDYDVLDAKVSDNSYEIIARAVNPQTGIKEKFTCKFAIINDKPAHLMDISGQNVDNAAVQKFAQYNTVNQRSYKNLISKTQLRMKLSSVIDPDNIDNLTHDLVENKILQPLNSATYASEYSTTEIIAYLSKLNQVNLEVAQEKMEIAKRDEHLISIADKRVMDNDTRSIEASEKHLSPKMLEVKDKISKMASVACNKKIITSKKLDQINIMLNESKTEKDLEKTWKELQKYFN